MTSEKQQAANIRNAQKSTGPNTLDGKSRSRRNALRDGLTGQILTLSDADRPAFEKLHAEIAADFKPQTAMERKLAESIAWDTWRLDHLRAVEANIYTLGLEEELEANAGTEGEAVPDDFHVALTDARTFRSESRPFDLMSLYEQRMTRNLHRNLAALRDLQAERKRNYERDRKEEIQIARVHEFNDMPICPSTKPSRNGFIFSKEDIATATVRQRYLDTAAALTKHAKPAHLYGALFLGGGDSRMERREPFDVVPPEFRALDRLKNPTDYGVFQPVPDTCR